ncbi:MAG: 50S ribosomal protein L4 [Bacteroidota bacterium]|jgi:large subunit ribosomal protein L4
MELKVLNKEGKETTNKVVLNKEIFGVEPNDHAIYLDVKQYLANQRQGTHKAKEKAEVAYSTRKLKRQKGTGGARAGSRKSGTMVGGGRFFGPRPRNYSFKLNKKLKVLARASALTYKAQENKITVVENFSFEAPKTKKYLDLMKNLNVLDKKTLLVLSESNKNVYLSARNLGNTKVVSASNINTYDVLNAQNLILSVGSLTEIEKLFN